MNNTIKNKFRPNVGIMIINDQKKIWMGKRVRKYSLPFCYQMPQGGIDAGETPEEALWRELYEETGLSKTACSLLKVSENWYTYPVSPDSKLGRDGYKGQRQKWFLLKLKKQDTCFCFEKTSQPEFTTFKWMSQDEVMKSVVPFKRDVYRQVLAEFSSYLNEEKTPETSL